jgi:DNA-3-methyladenine glycosylase I
MSEDVIIGADGKPRCSWAGVAGSRLARYHDEVWGTRTFKKPALFEALTLGVFRPGSAGWSYSASATAYFDVAKVAAMAETDVDRLVEDASIIRNRAKIEATIETARVMSSASPSLPALVRSYETLRERAPRSLTDLPVSTPQAESFARQLKAQGYRFVGPTSVYAFMQNVGVVNDHIHGCFRASNFTKPSTRVQRR